MFARLTGLIMGCPGGGRWRCRGAAQAEIGDDGLHVAALASTRPSWTCAKTLPDANAQGKRFAVIIEQRGCIYCSRMHEEVWIEPDILQMLEDEFFFVRINMHGSTEVTGFRRRDDGGTPDRRGAGATCSRRRSSLPRGRARGRDRDRGGGRW